MSTQTGSAASTKPASENTSSTNQPVNQAAVYNSRPGLYPYNSASSSQLQQQQQQRSAPAPQQQTPTPYYGYNTTANTYSSYQQPQQQQQSENASTSYQGNTIPGSSEYNSGLGSLPPINSSMPLGTTATATAPAASSTGQIIDHQRPLAASETKFSTTFWEDENTICYQVEARGVPVSRREDSNFVNGTKLLNVVGMTRGRRDGILKSEKTRYVVKIGAMNLKGVWIPFDRAVELATSEGVLDLLYPLFVRDIKAYYHEHFLNNPLLHQQQQQSGAGSPYEKSSKPRKKRTLKKKKDDDDNQQLLQYQNYPQYLQAGGQYNPYYQQQQPQQQQQFGGYYSNYGQGQYQTPPQSQLQPFQGQYPQQQQQYGNPQLQQQQQFRQLQPQLQQQYAPYQSLLPQQQEYVQQYYNYYRQFQPQGQQQQQQQQQQQLPQQQQFTQQDK